MRPIYLPHPHPEHFTCPKARTVQLGKSYDMSAERRSSRPPSLSSVPTKYRRTCSSTSPRILPQRKCKRSWKVAAAPRSRVSFHLCAGGHFIDPSALHYGSNCPTKTIFVSPTMIHLILILVSRGHLPSPVFVNESR